MTDRKFVLCECWRRLARQRRGRGFTVYYWPQSKRGIHGDKFGILHVKCAVADGRWLFLSTANLTEYAFTINMELGVLITGSGLPGQVEMNFDRMIAMGVVETV